MAELLFIKPTVDGPITAPAIEGTCVRIDAGVRRVKVNSESVQRGSCHDLPQTVIRIPWYPLPREPISLAAPSISVDLNLEWLRLRDW